MLISILLNVHTALETSRTVPTFLLVSIRTALLTNIKFGEGCERGCLFFAMSIVKIRLQKVTLNFHRRNGTRYFDSPNPSYDVTE